MDYDLLGKVLSIVFILAFVAIGFLFLQDRNESIQEQDRIQEIANDFCKEKGYKKATAYGKNQNQLRAINCYTTKEICLKEKCTKVIEKEKYYKPSDWQEEG